ncbi:hypothetical protein GC163_04710 [bacterium]|nr:hypothetical protein [bacterium]
MSAATDWSAAKEIVNQGQNGISAGIVPFRERWLFAPVILGKGIMSCRPNLLDGHAEVIMGMMRIDAESTDVFPENGFLPTIACAAPRMDIVAACHSFPCESSIRI